MTAINKSDKKTYHFEINKDDIENGKICSLTRCPVSKSIKRKISDSSIENVSTGLSYICIYFYDKSRPYKQIKIKSQKLKSFIRSFDNDQKVSPIKFQLTF